MNDSVREELNVKVSIAPKTFTMEARPNPPVAVTKPPVTVPKTPPPAMSLAPQIPPVETTAPKPQPIPKQPVAVAAPAKIDTMEIAAKATSPTLVEFQNKNATLPDWRLQLQNAVRKRVDNIQSPVVFEKTSAVSRVRLQTSGANALKAEVIEEAAPVIVTAASGNPKLANAMRRIEESRRRFLAEEQKEEEAPKIAQAPQGKNYPFYIATKNAEILPKPAEMQAGTATSTAPVQQKPTFEDLPVIEKKPLDTNKLKPLPNAAVISANLEKVSGDLPKLEEKNVVDAPLIKISRVISAEDEEILEFEETEMVAEDAETEDLAPFAMRFNSGVFDLIIGAFASFVLFSAALMFSGGNWYSLPGFLAFLVTFAVVMFVYMTTAIAMFGKTVGMKIFSLETIDIEENDYPTFHQAAVSSSVYLVSLALGGIGFLPALFNSERRTAPDLLSGTIVVKE